MEGLTRCTEDERLRQAMRVARLVSWEYDPARERIDLSTAAVDIAQVDLGEWPRLEEVLALLAPGGRSAFAGALAGVLAGEEPPVLELALGLPVPDLTWVEIRMEPVYDAAGRIARVHGTTQDVTARKLAELALEDSERRLREAQRIAGIGSFDVDYRDDTVSWSDEMFRLFAVDRATFGATLADVRARMPAEDAAAVRGAAEAVVADGVSRELCHQYRRGDEVRIAETRLEALATDGERFGIRATMQDVTEHVRAQEQIRLQALLLDVVDVAVIATGLDGRVTHWNAGAERAYGWPRADVLGRPIGDVTADAADAGRVAEIMAAVRAAGHWERAVRARRKDGSTFPADIRASVFHDAGGRQAGVVGVSVDVSERVETERRIHAAAAYQRAVTDSMGEGLYTLDTDGRLIDLNPAGEALLGWKRHELAGRKMHDVTHFRRADGTPLPAAECPLLQTRRDGAVVRTDDEIFVRKDGTELPVKVTAAPFETDDGVRGTVVVFSDISERKESEARMRRQLETVSWVGRIRDALADDRFVLHAQPIVELGSLEVVQHELLIRMLDVGGDLVPPGLFLPAAEEFGLIADIDRWVVRQALELAGEGHRVELNLSARSVGVPGFADDFAAELHRTGADPSLVVVELTETALLTNGPVAEQFVRRIRGLGCSLALDDFGTGYGGFTYLKHLPFDLLKIDREFVGDIAHNVASRQVVSAVVSLARGFGQRTVAEGVEDAETLAVLGELGVDYAQGFGIARPAPVGAVFGGVAIGAR